jgi:hypothetical protein
MRIPFVMMACGAIRSGKTHTCARLVHELKSRKLLTRCYVIAPSVVSNGHLWLDYCQIDPRDTFTDISQAEDALREVVSRLKQDFQAYEQNQKHLRAYQKHRGGEPLSMFERTLLEGYSWRGPSEIIPLPSQLVVLDDLQSTKVVSGKYLSNLILTHRHVAGGYGSARCGLSIIVMSQSLKSGALPRALRPNCSVVLFWKTADRDTKRDVYALVSSQLQWKQFLKLFEYCTQGDDYPYMVFDQTQPRGKEFRRKLEGTPLDVSLFKDER